MVRHRKRGWELPGGRLEPLEEPLEAALREFQEETGHVLVQPRLLLHQPRPNGTCWAFEGRWGPPAPGYVRSDSEEVQESRFVRALQDVRPLAFPNDPYGDIERVLGRPLRAA